MTARVKLSNLLGVCAKEITCHFIYSCYVLKALVPLLNVAEQQGKIIGLKVARRDISVNLR